MAQIGDLVEVTIRGGGRDPWAVGSTNSTTSVGDGLFIASGQELTVRGRIVAEQGDNWVIDLEMSVSGKNRIVVPKSVQRIPA